MADKELSRLLDRMIKTLNIRRGEKRKDTLEYLANILCVAPDTIYKWCQGRHKSDVDALTHLVEIGVAEANMDRVWAERVLYLGDHPQRGTILSRLFPLQETLVRHNLPRRPYIRLVGRDEQLDEVMQRLAPESRHWLVPIEGVGGVGKSALALEVGWRFVEGYDRLPSGRRFDVVVWASAKREVLTTGGIEPYRPTFTNLDDVYRALAEVLEWPAILSVSRTEQAHEAEKALRRKGRVLVILDNLETVDDPQVLAFLRDLPPPVKAVATMRFHEDMPWPSRLEELEPAAAHELIIQECQTRGIVLDDQSMARLLDYTRGMPLAIWWAIGLMAMEGYTVEATLDRLADGTDDLQRFIFGQAMARLRQRWPEALEVLLALTFFDLDSGATEEALAATVGLDLPSIQQARQRLFNLNLINRHRSGGRFTMLPLTRSFAQQELTAIWETPAREHWSEFFVNYVELYGDDDYGEAVGGGKPDHREKLRDEIKNLQHVIDWCFQHRPEKAVRLVERITTFLIDEGEWPVRLDLCQRALEVAKTPESRTGLLTRLAWSYLIQDDYEQARRAYEEGFSLAHQYGLQDRLVQLLRDLGEWYFKQGDYAQGHHLYAESLELAEKIGQEVGILLAKAGLGEIAHESGDYQKAKQIFLDLIPEHKKAHPRLMFVLRRLGEIAIAERKFDEARAYLANVESALRSYYDADTTARLYATWGDLERETGYLNKAQEAYEKSLDLATRLGMREEMNRLKNKMQNLEEQL